MEKLGIDFRLLITQIVNFTIMVVVLTKLLYGPILKSLAQRRRKIEEGLKAAESARQELEKAEKSKAEIISDAREEARVILENAKKDGKRVKDELVAKGRQEVAELKVRLEKDQESRYRTLSSELATKTVDIAAQMVARILPEILTKEDQHRLVRQELKKLEKLHGK